MTTRVSTPTILNVTLAEANTEYPVALPPGTTRIRVQARTQVPVKLAYAPGQSGTLFWTVKPDPSPPYKDDGLTALNTTLYLQCATEATPVEIFCWN